MAQEQNNPILTHLNRFLDTREPPKTFCPSEVARAFTREELTAEDATEWRDLMPSIRETVWSLRDQGRLEVLQKGNILGPEVTLANLKGPIRVRRTVHEGEDT